MEVALEDGIRNNQEVLEFDSRSIEELPAPSQDECRNDPRPMEVAGFHSNSDDGYSRKVV